MRKKLKYFAVFLLVLVISRLFLFEVYAVNQNSMLNTYNSGDRVLILKNFYSKKTNDILIFTREDEDIIKRCVGLPGESIKIINGNFYINNTLVPKPSTSILKNYSEIDIFTKSYIYYAYGENWTLSNFGNYVIPKRGMKIRVTPKNISLYENVINQDIDGTLDKKRWKNKSVYTFVNNYYFLVGDNRTQSIDSRVFGPVKESSIRGKVILDLKR